MAANTTPSPPDYTAFYEQIAVDRLKLAMDLEADRIANLDLSDSNVATERDVVMEERRMRVDNDPQSLLGEQMSAALHLSHPYGRPVIGWAEEIRHIDKNSAQDFYKRHYAPNNAILIVAGDVTPDQVRNLAQSEYGKLPSRELQPPRRIFRTAAPGGNQADRVAARRQGADIRAAVPRAVLCAARPGMAEGLETLSQILGGDQTATLYRVLVEDKKLASDAGSSYDGYARDAGRIHRLCRAASRRQPGDAGKGRRSGDQRPLSPRRPPPPNWPAPRPSWWPR